MAASVWKEFSCFVVQASWICRMFPASEAGSAMNAANSAVISSSASTALERLHDSIDVCVKRISQDKLLSMQFAWTAHKLIHHANNTSILAPKQGQQ